MIFIVILLNNTRFYAKFPLVITQRNTLQTKKKDCNALVFYHESVEIHVGDISACKTVPNYYKT